MKSIFCIVFAITSLTHSVVCEEPSRELLFSIPLNQEKHEVLRVDLRELSVINFSSVFIHDEFGNLDLDLVINKAHPFNKVGKLYLWASCGRVDLSQDFNNAFPDLMSLTMFLAPSENGFLHLKTKSLKKINWIGGFSRENIQEMIDNIDLIRANNTGLKTIRVETNDLEITNLIDDSGVSEITHGAPFAIDWIGLLATHTIVVRIK